MFFIPQEATEKLKLSHPTQPEIKPVKVHAPFFISLSSFRYYDFIDAEFPI